MRRGCGRSFRRLCLIARFAMLGPMKRSILTVSVLAFWIAAACNLRVVCATETADIVIYGGTSSGIIAVVQAHKMGKSVVLIEPSNHLGGLTTGGLGATDIGNMRAIDAIYRAAGLKPRGLSS